MQVGLYKYQTDKGHHYYEFISEGPKGMIKKIVRFSLLYGLNGVPFYNIGFGDWDFERKKIDYLIATNNEDTEKVLATIAAIVVDFTEHFPGALLYVEGSTPARTRRYQIGINKILDEIKAIYDVYGKFQDDTSEPFRKNVNYTAFWLKRK
jgi:hypothetical protein